MRRCWGAVAAAQQQMLYTIAQYSKKGLHNRSVYNLRTENIGKLFGDFESALAFCGAVDWYTCWVWYTLVVLVSPTRMWVRSSSVARAFVQAGWQTMPACVDRGLLKCFFGGCVMTLECDSVWKTQQCFKGASRRSCSAVGRCAWRAAGHRTRAPCARRRNTVLPASLCRFCFLKFFFCSLVGFIHSYLPFPWKAESGNSMLQVAENLPVQERSRSMTPVECNAPGSTLWDCSYSNDRTEARGLKQGKSIHKFFGKRCLGGI